MPRKRLTPNTVAALSLSKGRRGQRLVWRLPSNCSRAAALRNWMVGENRPIFREMMATRAIDIYATGH